MACLTGHQLSVGASVVKSACRNDRPLLHNHRSVPHTTSLKTAFGLLPTRSKRAGVLGVTFCRYSTIVSASADEDDPVRQALPKNPQLTWRARFTRHPLGIIVVALVSTWQLFADSGCLALVVWLALVTLPFWP